MIVALAGGIGGSKLLLGLSRLLPPRQLTIIGNTGDDFEILGLRVCPDLDTVTYTLAKIVNPVAGWGLENDTFHCLKELSALAGNQWFNLGDRDFATHIIRSQRLREGVSLSRITADLCRARGVDCRLLPMSDIYLPTYLDTEAGRLHLQEYLVREGSKPRVQRIHLGGAAGAEPSPGVVEAIRTARAVVLCPSNPLISIGPILAIQGIRQALRESRGPVIAVSPIIGDSSLRGPAAKMMHELGIEVSAVGVAGEYRDFLDAFVLHSTDDDRENAILQLGMRTYVEDIVMETVEDKVRVARFVLSKIPVGP